MISVNNLSLQFGKRVLFDEVNIKFTKGNTYGIIGANGAGKSTFLKILSGEQDPTKGNVSIEKGMRMAVLKQDHYEFDEFSVMDTVMMGYKKLYDIMKEKDAIYMKPDFSDEDGVKAAELEAEFAEMDGWNAESGAATLLSNLGVSEEVHYSQMSDVSGNLKVRILLAQSLFGNPDILLMDEPTNDLDIETISWLEDFLADFENTVIVISHDRHFLDNVCTNIVDIDFSKIKQFTGNYSFWYHSSQLALQQRQQQNKKMEDKKKELQDFIQRFSANASKSKQATSRKKVLEKLNIEDIEPSSRRYPAIIWEQEREAGDQILNVEHLESNLFKDVNINLNRGDKVAIMSKDGMIVNQFFQMIAGEEAHNQGEIKWGVTTKQTYLPVDHHHFFESNDNLVDWLRQYSPEDQRDEVFIRGFLGKMLFSGEEVLKSCSVLSGGEKVRCMLSKMMLEQGNILLMNDPTNHLDLESIQALNNSLKDFKGTIIFNSHDHEFIQTIANRIIEIGPNGMIDKMMPFDDYLADEKIKEQRLALYS
ncbi:MAG: ATP-binding cassette domain-containing protein [Flavobacteriales bacterium]|jgi:ATPase subunit of ABC transporter with duplicated ATPase domains|nr:ATP-binding cassette domain-containing protein [Flavobacteriales bacterium]